MTDFIPGDSYRLDVIGADSTLIVDSWTSQIKADVVSNDGQIQVDTATGKIYGPMIGNIEDIDGAIIYDADMTQFNGTVKGDLLNNLGSVLVDYDLNVFNGNLKGNVTDPQGLLVVDVDNSVITADAFHGDLHGTVYGDLHSDGTIFGTFSGDFNGSAYGDFFGDLIGSVVGPVTGDVTGNITGNVTGNLIGNLLKSETEPLTVSVEATPNNPAQTYFLGGLGHPVMEQDGDYARGSIVSLGASRIETTVTAHVTNFSGTPVIELKRNPNDPYDAEFTGLLKGDIADANNNNILTYETTGLAIEAPNNNIKIGNSTTTLAMHASEIRKKATVNNGNGIDNWYVHRGTDDAPTSVQQGDVLASSVIRVHNGTDYVVGGGYGFITDPYNNYTPGASVYPTAFGVSVSDGTVDPTLNNPKRLEFRGNGCLAVPILKSKGMTFADRDSLTPEAGMIVFNTSNNKFQGYTGSGWVDLH